VSGHSKWSSIKHKKAATDAKRGQLFTKVARELTMAARQGGSDPEMNPALRLAMAKARDANMPKDNVQRAIERATGGGDGASLEEVTYEGYAPGGTAVLVRALTDNRNRTVAEIRQAFSRGGGNLAESGAVAWMFDLRGVVGIPAGGLDAEEVQLAAIEAGALDTASDDHEVEVLTEPADMERVRIALEAAGYPVERAEIAHVPKNVVALDEKAAIAALKLLERLDELDDVSRVYSNADFPDTVLQGVDL
jgi:YebC/PmpR family DNA-binding regulatory protein